MLSIAQVVFYFFVATVPITAIIVGAAYAGSLNKSRQSTAGTPAQPAAISNELSQVEAELTQIVRSTEGTMRSMERVLEEVSELLLESYREASPSERDEFIVELEQDQERDAAWAAGILLSVEEDPNRQRRLVRVINARLNTSHPEPRGNTPLAVREREAIKRQTLDQ